jgi:hypothetical protein
MSQEIYIEHVDKVDRTVVKEGLQLLEERRCDGSLGGEL